MARSLIHKHKNSARVLNPRHKRVADRYLLHGNGSRAVREEGYSKHTANTVAAQILNHPPVLEYIATQQAKAQDREDALQAEILSELRHLALSNVQDLITIDADGQPTIDLRGASRADLAQVNSVATKSRTILDPKGKAVATEKQTRLGITDRVRPLELLGKHMGLFKQDEQRVVHDIADRLLAARRRIADQSGTD